MSNENFIERIASNLNQTASIKNVFGEPVQVNGKTIIPVARIAYGFGGGFGQGMKKQKGAEPQTNVTAETPNGEGAGGGGGMYVRSKGVYEISPATTRFIPANAYKQILIGMALGFCLNVLLFSTKKKK